jgi:ATP-dependent helicase HrpA
LPPSRRADAAVLDVRWMLEELRVSLFAQTVGTPAPVSDKRIRRAMAQAG